MKENMMTVMQRQPDGTQKELFTVSAAGENTWREWAELKGANFAKTISFKHILGDDDKKKLEEAKAKLLAPEPTKTTIKKTKK
jgi:hypothetical protein